MTYDIIYQRDILPPYFPRHIFLFDVAVIVCKRRGDNYEMKDILDLSYFKITNNPTSDREGKKVSRLGKEHSIHSMHINKLMGRSYSGIDALYIALNIVSLPPFFH